MQVKTIIPPNDWQFSKLLVFSLVFSVGAGIFAAFSYIGISIPVLTQVFGFIFITFIPGILLLRILRIHNTGWIECIAYSAGLSLALDMFSSALINFILPLAGISRPMTLLPLTTTLVMLTIVLMIAAYFRDGRYKHPASVTPVVKISLPAVLLLILLLLLTILSVRLIDTYQNNTLLIACILAIAAVVILAAFNRIIQPVVYPLAIFIIGLCLLYQTTLMSPYPVGSDIYAEYYYYQLVANNGIWDYTIASTVNSCLSITMLAPIYSLLMNIDGVWVFKAIYPLLFALAPLALYHIFSRQIGPRKAFLAAFFFMAVPTFSLEMIALCRQQVAEFFLALFILLLADRQLRTGSKLILASIFASSIVVSHYATGFIGFIYMGLFLPFLFILRSNWFRSIWSWLSAQSGGLPPVQKHLPLSSLWIIVAVFFIAGFAWYAFTASGINLILLGSIWNAQTGAVSSAITSAATSLPAAQSSVFFDFGARDVLIQTALGFDFSQVSLQGKLFRIMQITTQLLLLLGILRLIFKPKGLHFTIEYLSLCVTSCLLLAACIFLPGFAKLLNTTRTYHIALITLAPFCILGGEVIWLAVYTLWRKLIYAGSTAGTNLTAADHAYPVFIVLIVLIPYFLLTSGLVYEVIGMDITDKIDTPYSIALSSYRLDLSGVFTQQDGAAADWLSQNSNSDTSLYTDQHTLRLLQFYGFPGRVGGIPLEAGLLLPGNYMYFTKWNMDKNELAFTMFPGQITYNAGLRRHYSFKDIQGLIDAVNARNTVYYNGGALILSPVTASPVNR